jgi:starch synthase (maltosyl-transferring)
VALDLEALGLEADETFQVHDVLTDARYPWRGPRNYVELDPEVVPAHVFVVRRQTPDGLFA